MCVVRTETCLAIAADAAASTEASVVASYYAAEPPDFESDRPHTGRFDSHRPPGCTRDTTDVNRSRERKDENKT